MENVTKIVPFLWKIINRNKKSVINITTKENEIIVSIWSGRKCMRFINTNPDILITNIRACFQV